MHVQPHLPEMGNCCQCANSLPCRQHRPMRAYRSGLAVIMLRFVLITPVGVDELFRLQPEGIGHTGDVIEEGGHLYRVEDGRLAEAQVPQPVQIIRCHGVLVVGKLHGKGTESPVRGRQVRSAPIAHEAMEQGVGVCGSL